MFHELVLLSMSLRLLLDQRSAIVCVFLLNRARWMYFHAIAKTRAQLSGQQELITDDQKERLEESDVERPIAR